MANNNKAVDSPPASSPQSWNWLNVSQKKDESSHGNSKVVVSSQSHYNATSKLLLLNRPPTSTQLETKPKTISTATDGEKPVKSNNEEVEEFSKVRITDRTISMEVLRQEMTRRKFIKLQQMDRVPKDIFVNREIDWVTIGVLTRKTLSKPAANGSTFMVWGLSDLDGTELGLFLFGDAYSNHWKEMPGSIVAVLNATLLPATENNKFAFKVTQLTEIVKLGKAVDFGICKGTTSGEARCRLAVNTAKTQYCLHHIAANFIKAGRGRQQLNNSTGSLRKALFAGLAKPKNLSAGVYTSAPSNSKKAGWNPIFTKKRKRNDAGGGVLGVSTVLTASGAVVQRGRTRPTHATKASSISGKRPCNTMSLMDQLREPSASMHSAPKGVGAGSANVNQPSNRAQRIVPKLTISLYASRSAILAKDGKPLKQPKTKKVNMIHFMSTGSYVKK
ncbi:hypothetical protein DD238_004009 [Peronospora effusa]|uniref:Uncharacterized protein n=1 Tax=Peronospora effusa TaxID=542832 RepID=A0A3M6VJT4_9STRA|nr:hypothetical protein DD238_004009 [Peronospora effusa]RQM17824.1 hypothetical protein DD237_002386 [Peronospora effusa]